MNFWGAELARIEGLSPEGWVCPVPLRESISEGIIVILPCNELLVDCTSLVDREPHGICPLHDILRWGEVGGWIR